MITRHSGRERRRNSVFLRNQPKLFHSDKILYTDAVRNINFYIQGKLRDLERIYYSSRAPPCTTFGASRKNLQRTLSH